VTSSKADQFLALHRKGEPLVVPNPWDVGSAVALQAMGFRALATTSSGFAATLGRLDGSATRDEVLAHAAQIVAATGVPVSADLEDGFAAGPAGVAATVAAAIEAGLAGCSIEDFSRHESQAIRPVEVAVERVAAAVEAAAGRIVLTARAENYLHGRQDLADTIARLQRYQEAGADVLYAPGLRVLDDIAALVGDVDRPVNVLLMRGGPTIDELASVGVSRVSIGGAFAYAALGALAQAAEELTRPGPYGFWDLADAGRALAGRAFGHEPEAAATP